MSKYVIFGPDGGGKSTLARALTPDIICSYAGPIKEIAHSYLEREPNDRVDKEENFREVYRTIGERAKEKYGEDVWAKRIEWQDNMIVDDGRFRVEIDNLPEDCVTIYVNMTGAEESTCEVKPWECDYYLNQNNASDYNAFIEAFKMKDEKDKPSKLAVILAYLILIFGLIGMVLFIWKIVGILLSVLT